MQKQNIAEIEVNNQPNDVVVQQPLQNEEVVDALKQETEVQDIITDL